MQTDIAVKAETSFEITYQEFLTSRVNPDFRGKGTLSVRSGPTFVFTGKKREATGFINRALELEFRPEQIRNVTVDGRSVQFVRSVGGYEREDKPFIFFCCNESDATGVQALLPTTKDEDFVASRNF